MPIDIKQFKEAGKPLDERILGFLAGHREQAYSLLELMAELEGKGDIGTMSMLITIERMGGARSGRGSKTWDKYLKVVNELVQKGQVTEAQLQGTTYYAYAGEAP